MYAIFFILLFINVQYIILIYCMIYNSLTNIYSLYIKMLLVCRFEWNIYLFMNAKKWKWKQWEYILSYFIYLKGSWIQLLSWPQRSFNMRSIWKCCFLFSENWCFNYNNIYKQKLAPTSNFESTFISVLAYNGYMVLTNVYPIFKLYIFWHN